MAGSVKQIPEGSHTITPSITCRDAARAIEFYKKAFGAVEVMRMAAPDGKIMHAELRLGDSQLMLSDEYPGMAAAPSAELPCSYLYIYTNDVDAVFNRSIAAGGTVVMPVQDMFWGDRYGKLKDPFGHHWGLATHIEDVAPEEMARRSAEWMAKAAGQA